jgi:hypothetical protein
VSLEVVEEPELLPVPVPVPVPVGKVIPVLDEEPEFDEAETDDVIPLSAGLSQTGQTRLNKRKETWGHLLR